MVPTANDWAAVAWKSPFQGTAAIAGSFESLDRSGGPASRGSLTGNTTKVASGSYGAGGGQSFQSSQAVNAGDVLYFLAGPAVNGNASHDATELNVTITSAVVADLSSAARASPNPLTLPGVETDTFTVTNKGLSPAEAVTFTDPLPAARRSSPRAPARARAGARRSAATSARWPVAPRRP